MAEYIPKSVVLAEIESKRKYAQTLGDNAINSSMQQFYDGMKQGCIDILSSINTLEVKEEVLNRNDKTKLMQKCVKAAYKRGYDMGVLKTTNKMNSNTKEVDLEKEIECVRKTYFINSDFEKATLEGRQITNIAKHFFELGLKAQKL